MEILMLVRLFHPHLGGVEKHVLNLCLDLKERGHNVELLTEQYDKRLPLNEEYMGIRVRRIPHASVKSKLFLWKYMLSNKKYILNYNVIHVHDVFWWYIPLVFHRFYITFHGYEGSCKPKHRAVFQRFVADKLSKGSICVGSFMMKWYKAKPNIVIYGAGNIKPKSRSYLNNAVFYGRFDDDTGILVYIDMVRKLKNELMLNVYGDGPQLGLVVSVIEANGNMKLHPWNSNIDKLLRESRYIFVSRYLSILEAMQAKRLVFAVYNNEIKKDYLMCHPMAKNMIIAGSASELADKFNHLTDEQEHIMIERAYAWAKEQTWEKLADQYLDLWGIT
jgi:glycosyltransferase involved in cell wall biosynthesis